MKATGRHGLPAEAVLRCALPKQYRQLSYDIGRELQAMSDWLDEDRALEVERQFLVAACASAHTSGHWSGE